MSVAARAGGGSRTAPFGLLGDERLARLAAAGQTRAFAVVYERHHQALYRYCRSILRNDTDAQDALQSAFAAAFAAIGRGQRDAPIRPWLFRIAHNEAISVLRRRRPTTDLSAASDRCTTSVEDQVAERAELDMLLRDLRELNERQRSALVMRELSGLSHEEIAVALDTSVGAAKQTIYEARRSLFEFAEGRAVPCDEIRRTISDADGRLMRSRRVRAHLRECYGCAAFAAAIPERGRELRALAPVLPTAVAAGMLERIAGTGAAHGTHTGLAGLASGAAGKVAGSALAANALAGVVVVASATVGVTVGVDHLVQAGHATGAGRTATPVFRSVTPRARTTASPTLASATHTVIGSGARARSQFVRPASRARHNAAATTRRAIVTPATAQRSVPAATSGLASGHSTTSAPGHSGSAPGHNKSTATGTGNSASAPGHNKSSTTTGPGNSASARGHNKSTATGTGNSASAPGHNKSTTGSGNSASAPGHNKPTSVPVLAPVTATVPTVVTTPEVPPATASGATVSAEHKKH